MSRVEPEDLAVLYDKAWQQFKEDRDLIMDQYQDLKKYIAANNDRYAISGDTLAKYAELMIKQTNQVIELIKLTKKTVDSTDSLSQDDYDEIVKQIEKEDTPPKLEGKLRKKKK